MLFTMERIKLKNRADQKPLTAKPGETLSASNIRSAFITKVNNPSVNRFIGRVRSNKTGRISTLIRPSTRASSKAAPKPEMVTPGRIYAAIIIAMAFMTHRIIRDMWYC